LVLRGAANPHLTNLEKTDGYPNLKTSKFTIYIVTAIVYKIQRRVLLEVCLAKTIQLAGLISGSFYQERRLHT
jgi:hypothetical protein